MKRVEDVVIAGAGPAGAYCALQLSKKGVYASIFDPSHPREKPCAGGISPSVIEKFPVLEKFRSMGTPFGKLKIISCTNNEVLSAYLENGFRISRRFLDEGILNMAIQNGAKIVKEKVIAIQKKGSLWKIKTNKGLISARNLVGADGVNSIVRRKTIGPISRGNLALTFGYMTTSLEKEKATIKFLSEIPGYIWVFPGNDSSNIGIGSELRYGSILKKLLDTFISSYCDQIGITSRYAAMVPSAKKPEFFSPPCAGENWILIGDAAGHVDPISGEGIIYALWGGKLAAEAIEKNNLKSYDNKWREEYGTNLIERCKNRDFFYNPIGSTISILLGLARGTYSLHKK